MELLLLLGLGALALGAIAVDEEAESTSEPMGFSKTEDDLLTGTAGNDSLVLEEATALLGDDRELSTIDAGAGDDLIDLLPPGTEAGDPAITDAPIFGNIHGGDGDDTIRVNVFSPRITGGEGDDDILVGSASTNGLVVEGGPGDDTIDGSLVDDGRLLGGDGNDLILATGPQASGTGYVSQPDGGDGDDTIRYFVDTDLLSVIEGGLRLAAGGSGADRFEVVLNDGIVDLSNAPENHEYWWPDHLVDENTLRFEALTLRDFEPGRDTLVLEPSPADNDYALASIRMEEPSNDETIITMSYESESSHTQEFFVRVPAGGLTWEDVELIGADRALLVPLAGA